MWGVSFAVIVISVRHDDTLPTQPSLLWATAVESPLMTSRKKSAGLLWVSQVYPFNWKQLLYTSCAEYGGVTKVSCSYQCLRSISKLFVLGRDKPEHFKIKNDNVTFFSKYLSRWKTTRLIPKSEKYSEQLELLFCQFKFSGVEGSKKLLHFRNTSFLSWCLL